MNKKIVDKIFLKYNLGRVKSFKKIEIGFTNKVYLVNDKFILKVCEDLSNEKKFAREVFFYNFFKEKIPVPEIRVYDDSKKNYNRSFIIYPKIAGDNLYAKWHLLNNRERKNIIKELCKTLRTINESSYKEFTKKFKLNSALNWHDKVVSRIKNSLKIIKKRKLLTADFIAAIRKFVVANHHVLTQQKIALVYWDAHFDNLLIKGKRLVGILDFERTELSSLDFSLDIIKRMVDYPKKYMSEEFEKFAKKEDYEKLLVWFREFYPELFNFKNLAKRLAIYALEHDLDTLLDWPDSKEVRQMIAKTINYSGTAF